MRDSRFIKTVEEIVKKDSRYAPEAYEFVSDAVLYTMVKLGRDRGESRHISGRELLGGVRDFAVEKFGPMAGEILKNWGIKNSRCVGDIVFNMVDKKLLGKNENDSITDFENGLDFEKAFAEPFDAKTPDNIQPPVID